VADHPAVLTGRQEPEHESWFPGDEDLGDRCTELAARIGSPLLPWQWQALRRTLSRRPDGSWTHPDVCLLATRQSGKSEILCARILFGLFVLDERIVYSAQRWVTAEAVYRRLKAVIERRPSLHRRLARPMAQNSSRAFIELKSGASVALGVRSGDLGRGLDRVDLVCFDESYNLRAQEVSALAGAQLAARNAQTVYASTAPVWSLHPNCQVLADLRRLGLDRGDDLYYSEWCAPAGADRDDPRTWRLASPGFGLLAKERDMRRLAAKSSSGDARLLFDADYLGWGQWPPPEGEHQAIVAAEGWAALADPAPELRPDGPLVVAVDRSPDRKAWSIAAAGWRDDGGVHVELDPVVPCGDGPEAVTARLVRLVEAWDPCALVLDSRSPAAVLQPYLVDAGIEPHMTNTAELALACGGFLDAVEQGRVSHAGQATLTDAIAAATKRELPGGRFAWDSSGGCITPLMACTLAHWGLLTFSANAAPKPPTPLPMIEPDRAARGPRSIMTIPF
jgi:hypothetical protein